MKRDGVEGVEGGGENEAEESFESSLLTDLMTRERTLGSFYPHPPCLSSFPQF